MEEIYDVSKLCLGNFRESRQFPVSVQGVNQFSPFFKVVPAHHLHKPPTSDLESIASPYSITPPDFNWKKRTSYIDEVLVKARWHGPGRRFVRGDRDQLLRLLRRLGKQQADRLIHAPHLEHPFIHVLLLHAHPGAAQHQPLHPVRELRGQAVPNNPTVAQPSHAHLRHPLCLHDPGDAPRLERLAPLRAGRVGVAKEDEVGDVHVEVPGEVGCEVPPLPQRIGPHAMDEDQVRLRRLVGLGHPAVHGGALAEVRGSIFEASAGEREPEAASPRSGETETLAHRLQEQRTDTKLRLSRGGEECLV